MVEQMCGDMEYGGEEGNMRKVNTGMDENGFDHLNNAQYMSFH